VSAESARIWTVLELIRWTSDYLAGKGFHNGRLNAEWLLAGVLGLKRLDLYLQFDRPLTEAELAEFKQRLRRRARREPLQYIEGRAAFRELVLTVDPRVLIPRPETELLVGEVLRWAEGRSDAHVLDLGTGSGAIALSLAAEGDFARIVATDLSPGALEVAEANRRALVPEAPVELRAGSVYDPVVGERFDVIVSNPPYVAEAEREGLDVEVRDHEPAQALFAPGEGLDVIREIIHGAPQHLRAGGLLALEMGAAQADAVASLVRATPGFAEPRVLADLTGRERMVLADFVDSVG